MKAKHLMPTVILTVICLVAALLLASVNLLTAPIIEAAQNQAANEALLVVLPDGKNFEKLTLDDSYPPIVQEGYRADGGYPSSLQHGSRPRSFRCSGRGC